MDTSAVNVNVTVDDFDSVVSYADVSIWETPDPSSPSFNASASPWWMGTFHKTNVYRATISFNFTGPAIYIFGASGSSHGSYEIEIDGSASVHSAYSLNNASTPHLLYAANNLTYEKHAIVLRNLGAKFGDVGGDTLLFDFLRTTVQLAPAGATVSNITFEETDSALQYNGNWSNNNAPVFSGGGTTFTNQDKASVSLNFHGSAVYVFGDKTNNHRLYGVTLDNGPTQIFNGVSGCGGAFGHNCEQQRPSLKYIASNLNESLHSLRIENIAGVNHSFFDLDSIVVTVPSRYAPREQSSTFFSLSNSSPALHEAQNSASVPTPWNILLLILAGIWLIRLNARH